MNDKVKVTVIATGLGGAAAQVARERSLAGAAAPQSSAATIQPPPVPAALQAQMAAQAAESSQSAPLSGPNAPAGAQAAGAPVYAGAAQKNPAILDNEEQEAPGNEGGELARARAIAQRLGITNLTDDEYDVPTYLRRQQDREA
jgi:hypothetical protein